MKVDLNEIIEKLTELEHSIYGCGNGRVKVNAFIKKLKQEYGIK